MDLLFLLQNKPELDRIFNNKAEKELIQEGFIPLIPLELKAKRLILIFKIDNYIFSNQEELKKEETE